MMSKDARTCLYIALGLAAFLGLAGWGLYDRHKTAVGCRAKCNPHLGYWDAYSVSCVCDLTIEVRP